jgi:Isoleucyl-tRNA synthetase (EC 6.1.1.5)
VHQYLLAADTVGAYAAELGDESEVTATFTGAQLAGVRYDPLFDVYLDEYGENAFQILVADYVATGEGTGIVHQAPAYGEDDQVVCAAAGIPVILSLDDGGRFLSTVPQVAASTGSRRTSRSPSCCAKPDGCCRSRATSTATRTAGAAAIR